MTLSNLERAGIVAGIVSGLLGLLVSGLSYYTSLQALEVSRATARAQVVITSAYVSSLPKRGDRLSLELELQNFGQAAAEDVRAGFRHSAALTSEQMTTRGLQSSMPPGFVQMLVIDEPFPWPEDMDLRSFSSGGVAFFLTISFTDTSSDEKYTSHQAYYVAEKTTDDGRIELLPMPTF